MWAALQSEGSRAVSRTEGLDRLGMAVSLSCGMHCALAPVAAGFIATSGLGWLFSEATELWLLTSAIALGLVSLGLGYWREHGRKHCFGWFALGAGLLAFAKLGPAGVGLEPWTIGAGAVAIAVAHATNIRLCRRCPSCKTEGEGE